VIGTLLTAAALALGNTPADASHARAGDAVAAVHGTEAVLYDGRIRQSWDLSGAKVTVTQVQDEATGQNWALAGSPEFSLLLNSATTSSVLGWKLIGVTAQRIPFDPARADAGPGVELVFRYGLAARARRLELDRTWSLYPGAAVEQVSETIRNRTPLAFRAGGYSLAQLTSTAPASAQVLAYHGGSDWRQDFRVATTEASTFDDEGEVARFDDGSGAGWFLVGQRRGGAMSRVGRDSAGRTWVGVDNARDLFDWGPLMTSAPSYNRLENPAYPAPVRQRTLTPFGTLDLGQAYLGVYHGGAGQAGAAFATDFAAHVMPTDRQTVDLNTFHPWEHGPGLSDANLRPQALVFKELGGEVFMLDDAWQVLTTNGDWQWNTAKFPLDSNGVPEFVDYLHSLGLQLGLWLSPAEFSGGSAVFQSHPHWACTPVGDATGEDPQQTGLGVWNFTNKALRAYMTGVIDRLIAQDDVRELKFDDVTWVDCPPHDYLDYEDAYASWVHQQEVRHPDVTFELDETNDQRLWAFRSAALGPSWFDNGHLQGSSYPSRLLHDVWSAAPWIPPSSLGFGIYDDSVLGQYTVDYLMPAALLGHITFWTDLTPLTPDQVSETAWWVSWYEAHRGDLGGLVYDDSSADPIDGTSWAVFQPWDGDRGYVFAFRQGGASDTDTVALQGLDPAAGYTLTNVHTGAVVGTFTGAALEAGLTLALPDQYSAEVLSVTPS
jgi:alpha-galactosidase